MNFFNEAFPVRTTVGSDLSDVVKVEIDVIPEIQEENKYLLYLLLK